MDKVLRVLIRVDAKSCFMSGHAKKNGPKLVSVLIEITKGLFMYNHLGFDQK